MTTMKVKVLYFAAGILLTVFALYPMLKETRRDQPSGMLLSPEEVKLSCGKPKVDDTYVLKYVEGDKSIELEFLSANHRMFLARLKSSGGNGSSGGVSLASTDAIKSYKEISKGWIPSCMDDLVK